VTGDPGSPRLVVTEPAGQAGLVLSLSAPELVIGPVRASAGGARAGGALDRIRALGSACLDVHCVLPSSVERYTQAVCAGHLSNNSRWPAHLIA